MVKLIRKIVSVILISVSSICFWEIGKKQHMYINNIIEHKKMLSELGEVDDIQDYLFDKPYDWISVSDTKINYPLVTATDNQYYLNRDIEGNYNKAGSIYYDASDSPYNGTLTVIYGHSMRDGSYFNNLHYLYRDKNKFNNSILTISNKEGDTYYKPLGFATYMGNQPFYRKVDNMNINDAIESLKEDCDYINNVKPNEDSHIIALVTCEYSQDNGRLVVFYISE